MPPYTLAAALFASTLVRSVSVPGTNLQVNLATQVGAPYDADAVVRDVRYLWSLGRFEDIRVETAEDEDGVRVLFRVTVEPRYSLHEIRIEPNTFGVEMSLPEGTLLTHRQALQLALQAERQLNDRGYRKAKVTYALAPAGRSQYDLKLTVDTGLATHIKDVQLTGSPGLSLKELSQPLRAIRRSNTQEALDATLARMRSFYIGKGYVDATVNASEIPESGKQVSLRIEVEAGPRQTPPSVCTGLFAERRQTERQGILDFPVTLAVPAMTTTAAPGQAYTVGRIDFIGHPHYTDAALRRNFLLDEGVPLDQYVLRRSIARLNRTNLFQPIDERQVSVRAHQPTGVADITVHLTERKRGAWSLSGPVGPMSLAGPLRGSVGSRLPPWGRGLLELSTYTLSFNVFAFSRSFLPILSVASNRRLLGVVALERPFMPGAGWLSGFAVAPQIRWKASALSYASRQIHQRLQPLIAGDRGLVPEIQVAVNRPAGDAILFCEPPKPRFGALRTSAGFALHLLGALPSLSGL
jgi:outer membrane protein insertion porin family